MPAPAAYSYSAAAIIDANTSFRDLIDAGTGAGKVRLYSEADTLLAEIPLSDPSGTLDGAGVLTITASGPDTSADASGECTYGTVCDSDNTVVMTAPAVAGAAPVSGYLVLNNTTIVAGAEVSLSSFVVGA